MTATNNDELPAKWQKEKAQLLELLEHQAKEIERRSAEDRTPVFLDLGRLLIRPDAVQFIEPCGNGAKINGIRDTSLTPKAILALMGARIISPDDGSSTAGVTK